MIEGLPRLVNADPAIVRWGRRMNETFMVEVMSNPGFLPLAGARVEVRANDAEALVTASAVTDHAGIAWLTARRAGGTLLVASCRGFVPSEYWLYEPERGSRRTVQKLGTVGSRIVAETIWQILLADEDSILNAGRGWRPPRVDFGGLPEPRALDSMTEITWFACPELSEPGVTSICNSRARN